MYAVVKTGGKQSRVSVGDTIQVEKLEGSRGDAVSLSDVLLFVDGESMVLGRPTIDGASVQAEIVDQGKHPKVLVFKMKRR